MAGTAVITSYGHIFQPATATSEQSKSLIEEIECLHPLKAAVIFPVPISASFMKNEAEVALQAIAVNIGGWRITANIMTLSQFLTRVRQGGGSKGRRFAARLGCTPAAMST